jgi:hypothetical protein
MVYIPRIYIETGKYNMHELFLDCGWLYQGWTGTRFRPETRFFRVPVPAGTNKKNMAGTGTLSFSER